MDIARSVRESIADLFDIEIGKVRLDTRLEELQASDDDLAELMNLVSDDLDIEVPSAPLPHLSTVSDVVAYVSDFLESGGR